MSQTTYAINQGVGISGQPATIADYLGLTFNNPVVEVKFGRAVVKISGDDNGCKLPVSGTDVFLGVAIRNVHSPEDKYLVQSEIGVMKRGQIYVEVEEAVTPDDTVFVRFATGAGGSEKGIFRNDADTATAVALPGAKFLTSASAGGVAMLDLNLD